MDSIGLLAAWVGIVSFLLTPVIVGSAYLFTPRFQRWWAAASSAHALARIQQLYAGIEIAERPDVGYVADLVTLYGGMILNLVAAATIVVVSIEILDLGPALLASTLPFNIDAKLLTRFTGFFLLAISYCFVFRLASLAMKIRNKTFVRKPGFSRIALEEISALRDKHGLAPKQAVGVGYRE